MHGAEALTYIPPLQSYDGAEGLPREELLAKLSFNMNMNVPSGLSIDQFKKVLTGHEEDRNKIMQLSAEYFYYAEKQYNINGIFLAAIAIHESAWGTSAIAVNKKNLFGYGATDSNPYANAYSYTNYSESIDLVARALAKYYLNPAGTRIYGGEIASGTYYNGTTISAVNTRYATDKNWGAKVYTYVQKLYGRL